METKRCSKCRKEKPLEDFHKDRSKKIGVKSNCKMCDPKYSHKPKIDLPLDHKLCTKCKKIKHNEDFMKDSSKKDGLYSSCKLCTKIKSHKYYTENKIKVLKQSKEWYTNNKDRVRRNQRLWENKNRFKVNQKNIKRASIRRKQDPTFRLMHNIRSRIRHAVLDQSTSKCSSSFKLVGCTGKDLRGYLTEKFIEGMTWDNYGEWHIDHIRPCASFDLTDEKQQRECFHYTNLQPLWAKDNLKKSSFYEGVKY